VTEPQDFDEVHDDARLDERVDALLADPVLWEDPAPGLEDAVVAAIAAERGSDRSGPAERWARRANGRTWVRPFVAGAAAAAVLVLLAGSVVLAFSGDDHAGTEVALAGTELAPDASAVATVADTPQGTVVELDLRGLAPAPEGTYYQAWLREEGDDGESVSAGTFHLRGGDGLVELWAGVSTDEYPLITVTLQQEDGGAESSGEVVLRGSVDG
jgi:hypothetical protein